MLSSAQDQKCQVDNDKALQFPMDVALIRFVPEVVITTKTVIMSGLTAHGRTM